MLSPVFNTSEFFDDCSDDTTRELKSKKALVSCTSKLLINFKKLYFNVEWKLQEVEQSYAQRKRSCFK